MKTRIAYQFLLVIICLTFSIHSRAQADTKMIIDVTTAGTLSNLLGNKGDSVIDLTLSGLINGSDIRVIRNMKSLEVLNLSAAKICSGGYSYYIFTGPWGVPYLFYTKDDEIGAYTFSESIKWTSIVLPNSVKSIGDCAFYRSICLTSISVPNSVISIGENAFSGCSALKEVNLSTGLTTIGIGAFNNCKSLLSLTLPVSIDSIGSHAFDDCLELREIHCQMTTLPTIIFSDYLSESIFTNVDTTICILYVPKGTYEIYRSARNWGSFAHIVEEETSVAPNVQDTMISVFSDNNSIIVKGANIGDEVSLYNISGILLSKARITQDYFKVSVPSSNIYLLRINNTNYKISL